MFSKWLQCISFHLMYDSYPLSTNRPKLVLFIFFTQFELLIAILFLSFLFFFTLFTKWTFTLIHIWARTFVELHILYGASTFYVSIFFITPYRLGFISSYNFFFCSLLLFAPIRPRGLSQFISFMGNFNII